MQKGEFSIDSEILNRRFTDAKGHTFTFADRLSSERLALRRKDNIARFEIIEKTAMKLEVGHSPDFIECFFMIMPLFRQHTRPVRRGFTRFGF